MVRILVSRDHCKYIDILNENLKEWTSQISNRKFVEYIRRLTKTC